MSIARRLKYDPDLNAENINDASDIPEGSYCCISLWTDGIIRIRGTEGDIRELKEWIEDNLDVEWDYFSLCG